MECLDPKIDVVFKALFVRHEELLRPMLEHVLSQPIASLAVLNPEIPGELSSDKEVALDIHALLANQTPVDVEMQIQLHPERTIFRACCVARDYADQLRRGGAYLLRAPKVVVQWLLEPLFDDLPLHAVFEFRERTTTQLLSDQLQIHVIQLSKLPAALEGPHESGLTRWARFLVAENEGARARLAQEDPIMALAQQALEDLSQDPEVRRLARERSHALKLSRAR